MLSSRLNSQLKPALILVLDENPSNSSLGFQCACAYAGEVLTKFQDIHVILTEHDETHWFQSHVFAQRADMKSKMKVIDLFDENHRTKSLDECVTRTDEKSLIVIESLPWLLLRTAEGNLCRSLHQWSQSHVTIAVAPLDCVEDSSLLKNLMSISNIVLRVRRQSSSETIEARMEQRARTSVDTIKSFLRFSLDAQLNVSQLREEKISNRKSKPTASTGGSSKTDVTANLTFNLRLKDDELAAKNNLVLPYTKQHSQTSDDSFTIHYSYDKEDDIDEDEDDDLTL